MALFRMSQMPQQIEFVSLALLKPYAGVRGTLKHVPGLGRVAQDTHHFWAHVLAPVEELEASDWRPFRDILRGAPVALMVGHVMVDALDANRPASQSKAVMDGLIRKAWGFDGLIVPDDYLMKRVLRAQYRRPDRPRHRHAGSRRTGGLPPSPPVE